jgi:hypothetical protein
MMPDHLSIPGLNRPVTLGEYAQLEGLREADVLALMGQLKVPAAYFQGQWYIEAPPNCEERLAQLRSDKPGTRKEGGLADWVRGLADERTQSDLQPQRESRLSELPPRDPISQPKPVRAPVPQPVSNTQEDIGRESEAERLRTRIARESPPYESLTDSEKNTLLKITDYAEVPQPVDYGLTYYDLHLRVLGPMGGDLEKPHDGLRYKPQGKWLNFLGGGHSF